MNAFVLINNKAYHTNLKTLENNNSQQRLMQIPQQIPGSKRITAVLGLYSLVWIALEGNLWRALVMGVGWTAVFTLYLLQKYSGGRVLNGRQWVSRTAVIGLLFGPVSLLSTLIFMAVKTGLHAHGPEFTPDQINWILNQLPIGSAAGLLLGLGVGLLTKSN